MRRRAASALAALFLAAAPRAAAQVYAFRTFATADGVPHPTVYGVTQDRFGYLWIGTFSGAARYDGRSFDTWSLRDGLPGDDVRTIFEDRKGRLWLGMNGGVVRFDRGPNGEVLTEHAHVLTARDGLLTGFAQAIFEDKGGRIWIATRGGGVAIFAAEDVNGRSLVAERLRYGAELPPSNVWAGVADAFGDVWLATRGDGVVRLRGASQERYGLAEGLPHLAVFDVKISPEGELFVATSGGVARFLRASGRFELVRYGPEAAASASSLAFDGAGTMWVGLYGSGLAKVTPRGATLFREAQRLPSLFVTGVFVDREGTLWVATQGGGLARLASDRFGAFDRASGWPGGGVSSFAEVPGEELLVGTFGSGVVRIAKGKLLPRFSAADGLGDELVRSLLVARDGTLWVGTSSGVSFRRPGASRFTTLGPNDGLPAPYVTALLEGPDGTIWIGTPRGLARFSGGARATYFQKRDGMAREDVEALSAAPDGRILVGTGGGFSIFDGERFWNVSANDTGLPVGRTFSVLARRDGTLWLGGEGGLARFSPAPGWTWEGGGPPRGSWHGYGAASGLPGGAVMALVEDQAGALWVSTARGIARLDGDRFTVRDGLPVSDLVRGGLRDSAGRLWWGAAQGPVYYDPANDRPNRVPPPVYLSGVEVDEKNVSSTEPVRVRGDGARVTFRYRALSFAAPERVTFRTRLVGYDAELSPPGDAREARYMNLPPGRYRFEVVAANNDGIASPRPASVELVVPTPWWRSAWTALALVALLGGSIFVGHRVRVAGLVRRQERLERLVTDRTEELRDEARRSRALLDAMAEGVLFLDAKGRVRLSNPAAHAMLDGFPADSAALPPALARPPAGPFLEAVRTAGAPHAFRLTEGARTLAVEASPVSVNEREAGVLVVLSDVTDLLRLDRMKDDFISTVSHELRTPLTSIRGSLALVANGVAGDVSGSVAELVKIAARNSDRLLKLVNELLAVEKLEAGALVLSLSDQPLAPIVDRAIDDLSGLARESGISFERIEAAPLARVSADAERLGQALTNLLSNAARFSPRGETITVATTRSERGDRGVRIAVADHGPGIPEEFRPRIFSKFAQAAGADARSASGSGLGLAIAKSIVERHGGAIGFVSEVGNGTTFFIDLPLVRSTEGPAALSPAPPSAAVV